MVTVKNSSLFSHILNEHNICNARLTKTADKFKVSQVHKITDFTDIHYDNQRTSFEIITNMDDFDKRIDYKNNESRHFANTLKYFYFISSITPPITEDKLRQNLDITTWSH